MLPYIVITLAVIYFVMKGTGLLDEIARSWRSQGDREEQNIRRWFERGSADGDLNHRLEVFKDFLVDDNEVDDA
jgi:hypothetical protein